MAVQNPFFGKREPESFQPRSSTTSGSVLGSNAVNNGAASAQPVPPAAAPKPSSASDSSGSVRAWSGEKQMTRLVPCAAST